MFADVLHTNHRRARVRHGFADLQVTFSPAHCRGSYPLTLCQNPDADLPNCLYPKPACYPLLPWRRPVLRLRTNQLVSCMTLGCTWYLRTMCTRVFLTPLLVEVLMIFRVCVVCGRVAEGTDP